MSNYYNILGVNQTASKEDVKKAYKSLVKKYHPDIYKGDDREEKFKSIQTAYEVLYDDNKRMQYDQIGHERYSENERYSSGYSSYRDFNGFRGFGEYANVKIRTFSDLKWYQKLLLILGGILVFGLVIIGLIIWFIFRLIMKLITAIIK